MVSDGCFLWSNQPPGNKKNRLYILADSIFCFLITYPQSEPSYSYIFRLFASFENAVVWYSLGNTRCVVWGEVRHIFLWELRSKDSQKPFWRRVICNPGTRYNYIESNNHKWTLVYVRLSRIRTISPTTTNVRVWLHQSLLNKSQRNYY